jgi:PEP-CTERM motif
MAAAAVMALGVHAAGAAQASVVTFDDPAGNALLYQQFSHGQSFSDQGLTFTSYGTYMYVWDGSSPNSNGTNNNIFAGFNSGDVEIITKVAGGNFDLNSIDMAISWYDGNPTEAITVNGAPLTISQTLTTYNLNLDNVTSVTISGVPSNGGYWSADNIVFNAGVPEPAPWAMMILGVGSIGLALRHRQRGAAVA